MAMLCCSAAFARDRITTESHACTALKHALSAAHDQKIAGPESRWSCDFATIGPSPYFLIGLHGKPCEPNGCWSNLFGWYAIRKSDGRIYEWDMGLYAIGKLIE